MLQLSCTACSAQFRTQFRSASSLAGQALPLVLRNCRLGQAGGENKAMDIKVPAGITRLFKSNLDWNLYSDDQEALNDRKVQSLSRPADARILMRACGMWCMHHGC